MEEEPFFIIERRRMVEEQLLKRDISDSRVLEAMGTIPRQSFVTPEHRRMAYTDGPLPIGSGQTISQPYIVALMTQLLTLTGDEVVLEVGTGSGYQAAVLGHLAREVHTIERHADLARYAARIVKDLGYKNVFVHVGDGSRGMPDFAPYQGIVVTAASPGVPPTLLHQLDEHGSLVIPVGGRGGQYLERWYRHDSGYHHEIITPVAFVPLLGDFGWEE